VLAWGRGHQRIGLRLAAMLARAQARAEVGGAQKLAAGQRLAPGRR
jgi:hypothetical protein